MWIGMICAGNCSLNERKRSSLPDCICSELVEHVPARNGLLYTV